MDKLGVMTLSASDNCGSLLQTYALKILLEEMTGSAVDIINFSTKQAHKYYDILPKEYFLHNREQMVVRIKNFSKLKKEKTGYQLFREKYLGIHSKKEIFPDELKKMEKLYDIIVFGSDQIWNVKMGDYDDAFFGAWFNKKKIAYAPSLGGHNLSESSHYHDIRCWLKNFSALSAREERGKKSIEKAVPGMDVPVLPDPTLAVKESVWEKLVGERMVKEKYIFYYSWAYCDAGLNDLVKFEADRMNWNVYVIDARKWCNTDIDKWNFILAEQSGPLSFLNLMYYAERCYVQSFHGMIFAYIFKKDFWFLDTYKTFEEMDTRCRELALLLHMEDRILTPYNFEQLNTDKKIEYLRNLDIEHCREKAIDYLKMNILEDKDNG